MTLTFDQTTYRNLLAEVAPKFIETEEEYDRAGSPDIEVISFTHWRSKLTNESGSY